MSGLTQLIYTGWSGLNAAAQALQTISNNTANVNTPGYNVESVNQAYQPGVPGMPGTGTAVTSIQRAFDKFAFAQVVGASSANQAAQVTQTNAQNLAAIFPVASGGAGGLGAALTEFFSSASSLTQDPSNLAQRQAFLTDAQSLAATFNSVGNQLAGNLTSINAQMTAAVAQVNALTQQIATLNSAITAQSAAGGVGPSNSLLDARDNLVQQLGQQIGITTVTQPNGSINVYTPGGAMLVAGGTSIGLGATSGAYGDGNVAIVSQATGQDITSSISGGTLGGLVASRAQVTSAQNTVGGLAASLASAVNTQQSLGLDLSGAVGQAMFAVGGPMARAAATNTGGGTLNATITSPAGFVPGDFIIEKTAAGFQATSLSTGQVTALGAGPTFSLDGMTLTVSGTVNVGDSFELQPTANAARTLTATNLLPLQVAAAGAYVATPGSNLGNVTAAAGSPAASGSLPAGAALVPAAYFGQPLTVQFTSATTFNVLSSGNAVIASGSFSGSGGGEIAIAYPAGAPAGEVATIALSAGRPGTGDTFALTPGGSGSNANMVQLAGLANQGLLSGQTLTGAYATLVGTVGSYEQSATVAAQTTQGVLNQAQSVQQSISGVNLDEQAANLVSYQQAYQAAATVIGTAQTLFQSLLMAVGV